MRQSVVRPLFPHHQWVSCWGGGKFPLPGPTSLHRLPHIPRAPVAPWRPILLPGSTCCPPAPKPAALPGGRGALRTPTGSRRCCWWRHGTVGGHGHRWQWAMAQGAIGEHRHRRQWVTAWGCPGTEAPVPSPDHLCWLGGWGAGAAQRGSLCQTALSPSKAGSQACAPWEPRGSVALTPAPGVASPLAGVPHPSEQNSPLCMSNPGWQNHSWALPVLVRAATA